MKYDDASWHYGGDFPDDLPMEAGATHTGMFLAWALLNGLAGQIHLDDFSKESEKLRMRVMTPGQFFLDICDGKFTDEDLNDDGNAFAAVYFEFGNGDYLKHYEEALADGLPSLYHVADTWENYDLLAPAIEKAFRSFNEAQ